MKICNGNTCLFETDVGMAPGYTRSVLVSKSQHSALQWGSPSFLGAKVDIQQSKL